MKIFSIYDKLSTTQKDIIQCIDNMEIVKRDLLSKYRKMLADKDVVSIDKLKDMNIIIYGDIEKGVITLLGKDEIKDISLTSFLGIEVKTDERKSN